MTWPPRSPVALKIATIMRVVPMRWGLAADGEHKVEAWTVGQLRNALADLPDDLPLSVDVAEEPGGKFAEEQVVIPVGFGYEIDGKGEPFVGPKLRISCDYPSGAYRR